MNELKEAALKYAKMGLAVFPLIEKDKKPLTANGFKDATTDLNAIENWWTKRPLANIGIATGSMSGGLIAIDMDIDKDKGKDGYHSFLEWSGNSTGAGFLYNTHRSDYYSSQTRPLQSASVRQEALIQLGRGKNQTQNDQSL